MGPSGPALAGGAQGHDREGDAFQFGLFFGELPAGVDGLADQHVHRLGGVRGAHNSAELRVELQERDELGPRVGPGAECEKVKYPTLRFAVRRKVPWLPGWGIPMGFKRFFQCQAMQDISTRPIPEPQATASGPNAPYELSLSSWRN